MPLGINVTQFNFPISLLITTFARSKPKQKTEKTSFIVLKTNLFSSQFSIKITTPNNDYSF